MSPHNLSTLDNVCENISYLLYSKTCQLPKLSDFNLALKISRKLYFYENLPATSLMFSHNLSSLLANFIYLPCRSKSLFVVVNTCLYSQLASKKKPPAHNSSLVEESTLFASYSSFNFARSQTGYDVFFKAKSCFKSYSK